MQQTLSELAIQYKTTVKALKEANNIADVNKIIAGKPLFVPKVDGSSNGNYGNNQNKNSNDYKATPTSNNPDYTVSDEMKNNFMQCGNGISCLVNDYFSLANLQKKHLSYGEFKSQELNKNRWKNYEQGTPDEFIMGYNVYDDEGVDDFLRGGYEIYKKYGKVTLTPAGLYFHILGKSIWDFNREYPKTSKGLKDTAEGLNYIIDKTAEYTIFPWIKGFSNLGDMFWDITMGKEKKESMYQKENEIFHSIESLYDESLTPEQKEAFGFLYKTSEFFGEAKLVKHLATHTLKPFKPYDTSDDVLKFKPDIEKSFSDISGDIGNLKVIAPAKLLPDSVPSGRIDYRKNFLNNLENFKAGTSNFHAGALRDDLYILHLFDKNAPLNQRSLKWWTQLDHIKDTKNLNEVLDKLALPPEFGHRNSFYIAKVPKGTETTFISGRAEEQFSKKVWKNFEGGGFQVRFRDFDESWILDPNKILKDKK